MAAIVASTAAVENQPFSSPQKEKGRAHFGIPRFLHNKAARDLPRSLQEISGCLVAVFVVQEEERTSGQRDF